MKNAFMIMSLRAAPCRSVLLPMLLAVALCCSASLHAAPPPHAPPINDRLAEVEDRVDDLEARVAKLEGLTTSTALTDPAKTCSPETCRRVGPTGQCLCDEGDCPCIDCPNHDKPSPLGVSSAEPPIYLGTFNSEPTAADIAAAFGRVRQPQSTPAYVSPPAVTTRRVYSAPKSFKSFSAPVMRAVRSCSGGQCTTRLVPSW